MRTLSLIFLMHFFSLLAAQPQNSFFVIHCDPGYADNLHFRLLRELADSAMHYNVPLTMEFSPQWVRMILSDSNKIRQVRRWQEEGHEIAAHHHGIYHCTWDSLSNYPDDSIALYQPETEKCDSGILISDMTIFWNQLDTLAGDSLLLTWCASDEHPAVDLYPGLLYRTDGGRSSDRAFSNPYEEIHETRIGNRQYGPYTTCQIDYCFIDKSDTVERIIQLYQNNAFSSAYSTVGVVTHVFNYKKARSMGSNNYVMRWIRFISGKGCQTVREILRANPCKSTGLASTAMSPALRLYPLPFRDALYMALPGESIRYEIFVYSINGSMLYHEKKESGILRIDGSNWPGGIYLVSVLSDDGRIWRQKALKIR